MKRTTSRVLFVLAALALAACGGNSGTGTAATNDPAATATSDPTDGIQRYVAGEDNNFADLQGDPTKSSSAYSYYATTLPLPGSANCLVYVYKTAEQHFLTCTFSANSLNDARTLFRDWVANVKSAEPYWHSIEVSPLPQGDVTATLLADTREQHAIFLTVVKSGQQYRVTTTFGKMDELRG